MYGPVSNRTLVLIGCFSLDDTAKRAESDIPRPQHCNTKDMLRFLFSSCGAAVDATEVEPKDCEIQVALEEVRSLANRPNTPLRDNLYLA